MSTYINTNNLSDMVRTFNDLLYEVSTEYKSVIYIDSIIKACEKVLDKFEEFKKVGVEIMDGLLYPKEIMYFFQTIVEETKHFVNRYENERLLEREVITLSIFKDTLINEMIKYLSTKPEEAAELLSELLNAPAR